MISAQPVAVAGWQWYQSTRIVTAVRMVPETIALQANPARQCAETAAVAVAGWQWDRWKDDVSTVNIDIGRNVQKLLPAGLRRQWQVAVASGSRKKKFTKNPKKKWQFESHPYTKKTKTARKTTKIQPKPSIFFPYPTEKSHFLFKNRLKTPQKHIKNTSKSHLNTPKTTKKKKKKKKKKKRTGAGGSFKTDAKKSAAVKRAVLGSDAIISYENYRFLTEKVTEIGGKMAKKTRYSPNFDEIRSKFDWFFGEKSAKIDRKTVFSAVLDRFFWILRLKKKKKIGRAVKKIEIKSDKMRFQCLLFVWRIFYDFSKEKKKKKKKRGKFWEKKKIKKKEERHSELYFFFFLLNRKFVFSNIYKQILSIFFKLSSFFIFFLNFFSIFHCAFLGKKKKKKRSKKMRFSVLFVLFSALFSVVFSRKFKYGESVPTYVNKVGPASWVAAVFRPKWPQNRRFSTNFDPDTSKFRILGGFWGYFGPFLTDFGGFLRVFIEKLRVLWVFWGYFGVFWCFFFRRKELF
jgi:hypothetical protein